VTTIAQYVKHLDSTYRRDVTPRLGSTIRQLHEWTGEYRSTTVGAAPDSSPAPLNDQSDTVTLSKLEQGALEPDEARRSLVRIYVVVDTLVDVSEYLAERVDAEPISRPDDRMNSKLVYIAWQFAEIRQTLPPTSEMQHVKTSSHLVDELANMCDRYRPVTRPVLIDICHAHEVAGGDATIDAHYRKQHLCRWCGDFRAMHGVNPPPQLVRLHDRGLKITTSMLRSAGVKQKKAS
jgi:hypothetical protein